MNLGENIYRLRTEKNLSQGDLADALDVSRQSVSKWENNSAVPELDKLLKLAQIFGITIDELVTGERKEDAYVTTPTPPPQTAPTQSAPAKLGLTQNQILGMILLVFGGLCLIVFTVVGIFTRLWLLGLFIALPFLLCSTVCLVCKKNVGLKCAWCIYIPMWLAGTIIMINTVAAFGVASVLQALLLVTGLILTIITIRRMVTCQITLPRWAKILLSIAMILGLAITLVGMLPPMEATVTNPFITEETHIVIPVDPSKVPETSQ